MSATVGVTQSTVWGFPIPTVYQNVVQFYRREKPQVHLEYRQRIELLALFKQVKLGPYSPDKDTDTGYFDVVGADRRKAWKALGDMSKEKAQAGTIEVLEGVCPELNGIVLKELEKVEGATKDIRTFNAEKVSEDATTIDKTTNSDGVETTVSLTSVRPASPRKGQSSSSGSIPSNHTPDHPPTAPGSTPGNNTPIVPGSTLSNHTCISDHSMLPPATIWYSRNSAKHFISEFQSSTTLGSSCAPLTLAAGETVFVQVPTSPHDSALFWELVTAHGNMGFGLSFQRGGDRVEGMRWEVILPLTVRDCSNDLLLGSHPYMKDRGTYLLEFNNSHSITPQVVYYRVFYQNLP